MRYGVAVSRDWHSDRLAPESAPSPISSPSSTGGDDAGTWWLGALLLPLGFLAALWRHLAVKNYPTSQAAAGGVNPGTSRGNVLDGAPDFSVPDYATSVVAAGGAAAGTTATTTAVVVPVSPVPGVASSFGVHASTTVIATAEPAASFVAGGGGHPPRDLFGALFGGARQPLPTAVAVPYGTASELAPV